MWLLRVDCYLTHAFLWGLRWCFMSSVGHFNLIFMNWMSTLCPILYFVLYLDWVLICLMWLVHHVGCEWGLGQQLSLGHLLLLSLALKSHELWLEIHTSIVGNPFPSWGPWVTNSGNKVCPAGVSQEHPRTWVAYSAASLSLYCVALTGNTFIILAITSSGLHTPCTFSSSTWQLWILTVHLHRPCRAGGPSIRGELHLLWGLWPSFTSSPGLHLPAAPPSTGHGLWPVCSHAICHPLHYGTAMTACGTLAAGGVGTVCLQRSHHAGLMLRLDFCGPMLSHFLYEVPPLLLLSWLHLCEQHHDCLAQCLLRYIELPDDHRVIRLHHLQHPKDLRTAEGRKESLFHLLFPPYCGGRVLYCRVLRLHSPSQLQRGEGNQCGVLPTPC